MPELEELNTRFYDKLDMVLIDCDERVSINQHSKFWCGHSRNSSFRNLGASYGTKTCGERRLSEFTATGDACPPSPDCKKTLLAANLNNAFMAGKNKKLGQALSLFLPLLHKV